MDEFEVTIHDIFFMPCLEAHDVDIMMSHLLDGKTTKIGLAARHYTDEISSNITVCEIVEVIPRLSDGPDQLLHRIKVTVGGGFATIILDYPNHEFSIEESDKKFASIILDSFSE